MIGILQGLQVELTGWYRDDPQPTTNTPLNIVPGFGVLGYHYTLRGNLSVIMVLPILGMFNVSFQPFSGNPKP